MENVEIGYLVGCNLAGFLGGGGIFFGVLCYWFVWCFVVLEHASVSLLLSALSSVYVMEYCRS